ncbi:MAG: ferredoxin [Gammaproteobacteria bacterium HGW-Gammaproteobacteria-3]|nr:MAG: ferredoxin [Gammaproteobacteria bacterium HGW-Gammaproteobacteria-3]
MSEWFDVIDADAMANGENLVVDVDGTDVAVFKLDGKFYAIEDVCSHDGAEIASGTLEGDEIICPRHGARFCIRTGAVKSAPAYEDITCFPVRIENGRVQVKDDRWD